MNFKHIETTAAAYDLRRLGFESIVRDEQDLPTGKGRQTD